jgi:hypothetical protein
VAIIKATGFVGIGLLCGFVMSYGWAAMTPPTGHKGLEVEKLGYVPQESMAAQVGIKDRILLLRRITINPRRADRKAQPRESARRGLCRQRYLD